MTDVERAPIAPAWLAARRKPFCLLCGKPTSFTNVYIPGKHSPLAPPPGKGRLVVYSLCESCAGRFHELSGLIEARLEHELRGHCAAATPCGAGPGPTPRGERFARRHRMRAPMRSRIR